jgi:leukotriene-A4 hydrolase
VVLLADTTRLIVDTAGGLTVSKVTEADTGAELKYAFGEGDATFGKPLQIELPAASQKQGAKVVVRISYSTTPDAGALQWLPPAQTKGGKYPYLFSQSVT